MSRLLVSVRTAAEAEAALAGGADVIDVKEPNRGPLGRPDPSVIESVIALVAKRKPVTASAGELGDGHQSSPNGLTAVKIGTANPNRWSELWLEWSRRQQAVPVLVAYADLPHGDEILNFARNHRPPVVLIDTHDKIESTLLDHLPIPRLRELVAEFRELGITLALAGRLDVSSVAALAALGAAIIGVRGAACSGGRAGVVSRDRVALLKRSCRVGPIRLVGERR
jgi:uncharacterized protein (UPF0264 family)